MSPEKVSKISIEILIERFADFLDPWIDRCQRHKLIDIVVIGSCCSYQWCGTFDRDANLWQSQRRGVEAVFGIAFRHSVARYIWSRAEFDSVMSHMEVLKSLGLLDRGNWSLLKHRGKPFCTI